MRSILDNTPYPVQMYNAILNRVKVERSINYARAGFIKACLVRLNRTAKNKMDMITVSLNEESQSVPYRLGRLFAVLEKDAERYEQGTEEHHQQQIFQQRVDNAGRCVPGPAETGSAPYHQVGLGVQIEPVHRRDH